MSRLVGILCAMSVLSWATGLRAAPETGMLTLTSTLTEVLGPAAAGQLASIHGPDEIIRWEVVVPESYDAAAPAGLLVYISPTPSGRLPERWSRVLDARNLIWIGADAAGNSANVQKRALFAVIAPTLIGAQYALDSDRIYVSGLSGGGKMASMVATDHARLFTGAIFICGVEFWDSDPRYLDQIRQNRYVFVTGEHDQALRPTRRVYGRYRKAGVERVKLMEIDGMGHENPDAARLAEAIDFLDGVETVN